jgi:hypothetical protein
MVRDLRDVCAHNPEDQGRLLSQILRVPNAADAHLSTWRRKQPIARHKHGSRQQIASRRKSTVPMNACKGVTGAMGER